MESHDNVLPQSGCYLFPEPVTSTVGQDRGKICSNIMLLKRLLDFRGPPCSGLSLLKLFTITVWYSTVQSTAGGGIGDVLRVWNKLNAQSGIVVSPNLS